jgi:hypothetical protein
MIDREQPAPLDDEDEPVILSLEDFRRANALPDETPPDPSDNKEQAKEAFWAGRNHAMRRSARWAA